jgi:hypothetical protein
MQDVSHEVLVTLLDSAPDDLSKVIEGDGESLGPTLDAVRIEAVKNKGELEDWEPKKATFRFPSKDSADEFITAIANLGMPVEMEYKEVRSAIRRTSQLTRLPDTIEEKVLALGAEDFYGRKPNFFFLDNGDCLKRVPDSMPYNGKKADKKAFFEMQRLTNVNVRCNVTGKVRSSPLFMRSVPKFFKFTENICNLDERNKRVLNAKAAGWSNADITFDFIMGILDKEASMGWDKGQASLEAVWMADTVGIVIHDYNGEQFVGWFYYNSSLDKVVDFSAQSVQG